MKILKNKGVGLIEAIVVISIISTSFAAVLGSAVFFLRGGLFAVDQVQALFLLDESAEAVRFMRDQGFTTNITPLVGIGPQYLTVSGSGWSATTTNTTLLGKFSRTIEITEVYRRNSDDVIVPVSSGDPKTLDAGTVRLEITIDWGGKSVSNTTYVSDLYEN
jgi:type II secretory pathway pseudopilin PulG